MIVSKSLAYTGIGSNTKSTTQQLKNEKFQVSLDFRAENQSISTVPDCSTALLKITISQLQSSTKLKKTTNGFKQSSNCPAIQLTFFWPVIVIVTVLIPDQNMVSVKIPKKSITSVPD